MAAADYYVEFRPGKEPEISWKDKISDFLAQPEITVMKKTKRSEKEIDIRPFIYKMELQGDKIFMMLASASANYTTGNRYILLMAWHRTSGICLFHQTSGSIRR